MCINFRAIVFLVMVSFSFVAGVHAEEMTFTYCAEVGPITFNPQLATDGATFTASSQTMYNRLVGFEGDSTKVSPSLAKSWTVSSDGRVFTFKLRDDVSFHVTDYFKPTRNFNADDVLFSFERMRDAKHPYHKVGGGEYPSFLAQQMGDLIAKIEKIDNYTVRFTLHRPEAPFLANMAMDFASILSAEYGAQLVAEKKMENIDKLPVGTGPFVFVWYDKDKSVTYKAHPRYFEGKSKIDHLIFSITADPKKRLERVVRNECQLMPEPQPDMIAQIKMNPELKLLQQPGLNIAYLAMATQKPPFDDINVRKAIHHALNRQQYIKDVYGGNAQLAKNPIPPTMWSYNRAVQDYEFSLTKAKEFMAKSNTPKGFSTELWYADISRPYNPNAKKMAQLIKKDLEAIGISVTLVEREWKDFLARSRKGEPTMSLQGWTGDNGDPDNFLNNLLSCQSIEGGNNRAHWCNKKFSFLIDRARVTTNIRKRTEFYEEAQKIFKEEVPWVTLAHSTEFKVSRRNVTGFRLSPFGVLEFYKVSLK